MAGAYTPALIPVSCTFNCEVRSSTWPICVQFTKSFEWKIGTPGNMANDEHTRK